MLLMYCYGMIYDCVVCLMLFQVRFMFFLGCTLSCESSLYLNYRYETLYSTISSRTFMLISLIYFYFSLIFRNLLECAIL